MKRERFVEEYEDFEPEMRIWPFALLSFLLPLIPFCLKIVLQNGLNAFNIAIYCVSVLPLLFAAICLKDGEKAWLLLLSSALYLIVMLLVWINARLKGEVSSVPFYLDVAPAFLSLLSFAFFNKRRRMAWLGWTLLSLLFSSLFVFLAYKEKNSFSLYLLYPSLLVVLSLSIFFVTRRTDSSPWFITLILFLLVLASFTLYPGFVGAIESKESIISYILKVFLFSSTLWYTLSFLFVFSALAGKSSYKKSIVEEDVEEHTISPNSENDNQYEEREDRYTAPPEYSRFDRKDEKQEEKKVKDEPETKIPPNSKKQADTPPKDDKWYEFIKGGVNEETQREERRDSYYSSRENERRDNRDRDRDDYYYRDRDYDRRNDDYRPRSDRYRYDDRDRDRDYYSPRRRDDDRDYYPRRYDDRSNYDDRDNRRYSDDRDRPYYDDDYDERDRRR